MKSNTSATSLSVSAINSSKSPPNRMERSPRIRRSTTICRYPFSRSNIQSFQCASVMRPPVWAKATTSNKSSNNTNTINSTQTFLSCAIALNSKNDKTNTRILFSPIWSSILIILALIGVAITGTYGESFRPSRSLIAPSLPQIIPSSHVSYEDGRRGPDSAESNQDTDNNNNNNNQMGRSTDYHYLSSISSQNQQQGDTIGSFKPPNIEDTIRFRRTPLVSSPISSLLSSFHQHQLGATQRFSGDQLTSAGAANANAADHLHNEYNHHRYGWPAQKDDSSSVSSDLAMSGSSSTSMAIEPQMNFGQQQQQHHHHQQQQQSRHQQTLQHRSLEGAASLGRSMRQRGLPQNHLNQLGGAGSGGSGTKPSSSSLISVSGNQQDETNTAEWDRLRQRQHIQYHDQWPSMAGKCHKRTLNFCARVLPFNTTIFPNIIGDTNRFEVKRSLPFFGFLAKSSCNRRLDQLLCMLLEPPCQPETSKAIPPCKKFCRVALEGCGEYIPATLAMSSVFDCRRYPDSNDPSICVNLAKGDTCSSDEFKCPDKTCIPRQWLCDGVRDCVFAADEANCTASSSSQQLPSVCSTEEFKCDGKCVPKSWKCDKERDCLDGSDEEGCDLKPQCGPDRFKCADGNGCIPKRWVCDGKAECRDGSDEQQCDQRECSENDFKCDNGICIPKIWRCDRQMDCKDGSDEFNCIYPTSTTAATTITTKTTVFPTVATQQQSNETISLPDIETLFDGGASSSDSATETVGGQNNNDDRSSNLSSSSQKQPPQVVDPEVAETTTSSSNVASTIVTNGNYNQQQASSNSFQTSINHDDTVRFHGIITDQQQQQQQQAKNNSNSDTLAALETSSSSDGTSSQRADANSSHQQVAATIDASNSNDAKTSYVVDEAKQVADIQINLMQQPQQQMILARNRHHAQQQKQLASIAPSKQHNQLPQAASSHAPTPVIINNDNVGSVGNRLNEVVDANVDSSSTESIPSTHSTPSMAVAGGNIQVAPGPGADSLLNDDNQHQKQSLILINNQYINQKQPQQHNGYTQQQQLTHLQQSRRLFSPSNKYGDHRQQLTAPHQSTHQSRAPKLQQFNYPYKLPIYRSLMNTLTGNHHFHHRQHQVASINGQSGQDQVAGPTSYRQKRDRLKSVTQIVPATIQAAIQAHSTSVSPFLSSSSASSFSSMTTDTINGSQQSISSTSSAPNPVSPNAIYQSRGGAASYFNLLSRYNLSGHRSPKATSLMPEHQPYHSAHMVQNKPAISRSGYFSRNHGPLTSDHQ